MQTQPSSVLANTQCPENRTLFQAFEWYTEADQQHWKKLTTMLPDLKNIGIDLIQLPPGCKARGSQSNGYDVYDLFDLGEFDQKGARSTKWGDRVDLQRLVDQAKSCDIGIVWDAVLNHRAGADYPETCAAVMVDPRDRRNEISETREVEVWTGFEFDGRRNRHNHMKLHWNHFSGVDWDARSQTKGVFKFKGENKPGWAKDVDGELGNYDYLMFADVDYSQTDMRNHVLDWSLWIGRELGLSGFRLDATKHYSRHFQRELVKHVNHHFGNDFFIVGEYWSANQDVLCAYVKEFDGRIMAFDVPLVYNLHAASIDMLPDLRIIFDGTLVQRDAAHAVTFVANHDTQECQALAAPVAGWFVPHAYALILLRLDCGFPSVFYGDIFGTRGPRPRQPACHGKLARLILARKLYGYGSQRDYFDRQDCVGWTRRGHPSRSGGAGLAVVISNSRKRRQKKMFVGHRHGSQRWVDVMEYAKEEVVIDAQGFGTFPVPPRGMGLWIHEAAEGVDRVRDLTFPFSRGLG